MQQRFIQYIKDHNLCRTTDKILLAVSGGADSVVMTHLFFGSGHRVIGIAHCNFQLRGTESDEDAAFVENLAGKLSLPYYTKKFDTAGYADENGISVQMAARDLRYKWMEEVRQTYGFGCIAVGHHRNDIVETFLLNLTRSTGLMGLTGISPKTGRIIRPLLFATRHEIDDFIRCRNLRFREDSSNITIKYKRNYVRHILIPAFEKLDPDFCTTTMRNIERFREIQEIFKSAVSEKLDKVRTTDSAGNIALRIDRLKQLFPINTFLYELLKDYGFTPGMIPDIVHSLDGMSGKQFNSPTHKLVRDRKVLIITPLLKKNSQNLEITEDTLHIDVPVSMSFTSFSIPEKYTIPASPVVACLDHSLLTFPLVLRKWKKGDKFIPLGMRGMKKLSDFFSDKKMSLPEKEAAWILESGGEIVWIAGHRIDNRFRITEKTTMVFRVEISL
ncbi:MAG: tRNA lysidine(34) synthetase TilS [Bacteroidetes bacterium]|nr:tRNA lysidine(34) synthetase TilS [Bacteroidota bacterium]